MTHLISVVVGLAAALLLFAAYVAGYRRATQRTVADITRLRQTVADQQASLTAIPASAIEHRQQVAADHRRRAAATIARLDAWVLTQRTVRHG
ncbi:hypothetical protein EYA84_25345 [Verrucosispora sp. SN26_14.1]|uniref:hypothetical protein n=1 Tax=Verrucosispora sp. SN26_14.1 TaxID=2527879 RepID=UPI001033B6D0|nr:hypothetical protein [Verrucosispora sp. SN26_14.1]TBL29079.1 hypothetical protein EYA84_25345 [Verrucosispora sp. SN26_14.1]